jgi:FkbM family methyltransferase
MLNRFLRPEFLHRPQQVLRAAKQRWSGDPQDAVTCRLPWALPVTVEPSDYIGHGVYRHGLTALEACEAAFRLMGPGDIAIDAGANQGIVTSAMAFRAGRSGRVIAIEMLPQTFQKLSYNVENWGETGSCITLINSAVSDRNGTIHVGLSPDFARNSGVAYATHEQVFPGHSSMEVECIRIDDLIQGEETIKLLKLDVERHEFAALKGAEHLLSSRRITHIVFEDPAFSDSEAKRLLRNLGYTIFSIRNGLWKPSVHRFDASATVGSSRHDAYDDFIATLDIAGLDAAYRSPGYRCLKSRLRP